MPRVGYVSLFASASLVAAVSFACNAILGIEVRDPFPAEAGIGEGGVDGASGDAGDAAPCVPGTRQCGDHEQSVCDDAGTVQRAPCQTGLCAADSCVTTTQIAAGDSTACTVLADHSVYCWGRNDWGQVGDK